MKKFIYLFKSVFLIFYSFNSYSQVPEKVWDRTYGGTGMDGLYDAIPIEDGGAVLIGQSISPEGEEKSEEIVGRNTYDFWIVRVDSFGEVVWDRTIGYQGDDSPHAGVTAVDGGYIATGYSFQEDTGWEALTVKIGTDGQVMWKKLHNMSGGYFNDIVQASDGGYVAGGRGYNAEGQIPLVKLSSEGNVVWEKFIQTDLHEITTISNTPDGGYLLGGIMSPTLGILPDIIVIKTDVNGNKVWEQRYGGDDSDLITDIIPFEDGGYLFAARSRSGISGDKSSASYGDFDYWILKVDENGNKIWDTSYGGSGTDHLNSIYKTENGFLLGGSSDSPANEIKSDSSKGSDDFWVIKIDESGLKEWDKTIGGSSDDHLVSVKKATDGSIFLAGGSISDKGGDKTQDTRGFDNHSDFWVVKIDTTNILTWNGAEPSPANDAEVIGDVILGQDVVMSSLTIASGNSLVVKPGVTITVNGDINGLGSFILSDGSSLIMNDTSAQEGIAEVEKRGWSTQKYNLMGSPVTNSTPEALGSSLYYYDESKPYGGTRWMELTGSSLIPGVGYTSFSTGMATFSGSFNNGTINVDINRTEAGDDGTEGWNLLANPYPSAISYDDFMAVNGSEVNGFIYLWDESGKSGYEYSNGDYLVYDGTTTVGGNGGIFNGNLNSCQGFFVQKASNGTGTVSFTNAMRIAGNNNKLLKLAATGYPYIKVKVASAEGQINDLLVKFPEDASAGQDSYDAYHMKGNPDLAFYSRIGNGDFIINALPQVYPAEVQLGLDNIHGTYTFSLSEFENLNGMQVYLEDLSEKVIINLNETTYTVDLVAAEDLQRFKLHVSYGEILPVNTSFGESTIAVFSADGTLFINDLEIRNKDVKIIDLSGRLVSSFNYSAAGKNAFDLFLQPGFYLINIKTAETIVSQRVQISR